MVKNLLGESRKEINRLNKVEKLIISSITILFILLINVIHTFAEITLPSHINMLRVKKNDKKSPIYHEVNGKSYVQSINPKYPINHPENLTSIPLEDYLKGVVPAEMDKSWSIEALKAQAVAARSYVCSPLKLRWHSKYSPIWHNGTLTYNSGAGVCDSTNCQAYTTDPKRIGISTDKAVDDTAGEVLIYNGRITEAEYFSHSHIGYTRNGHLPYLKSVPTPEMFEKSHKCPSEGKDYYGHGRGMSQYGAKKLAEQNYNYREILFHYYTLPPPLNTTDKYNIYKSVFNPIEPVTKEYNHISDDKKGYSMYIKFQECYC